MRMIKQSNEPLENVIPTTPYKSLPIAPGAKVPTFRRVNVTPGRQHVAFTGRGVVPDYMSEYALTMMPEASRTILEHGVHGVEGMMPPAGHLGRLQIGQSVDGGSGGAGSFATVTSKAGVK